MALTKLSSLQPPMPNFGSGEMLGVTNVPNGDFSFRPPASFVRSSWPGVAWQAEQLPAVNITSPLARSGWYPAARADAGRGLGAIRNQTATAAATASTAT